MIDYNALEMADIEINSGPPNPAMDKAFSEFLKARRKEDDEMSAFRRAWDDFQIGPSKPLTAALPVDVGVTVLKQLSKTSFVTHWNQSILK